jgi:hypothetical protein
MAAAEALNLAPRSSLLATDQMMSRVMGSSPEGPSAKGSLGPVRKLDRTDELGAHIRAQAPNDLVTPACSRFVGREKQLEVIRDFEAVELEPHTAIGIVLYQARMFFALSEHDCCDPPERVPARSSPIVEHVDFSLCDHHDAAPAVLTRASAKAEMNRKI